MSFSLRTVLSAFKRQICRHSKDELGLENLLRGDWFKQTVQTLFIKHKECGGQRN